ncbi:MAG: NnrS family protein [Kiloniellaceae bacterium]
MTTRTAVPRYRSYDGPALFRQGFRPFFLAAGMWSALAVPLWLLVFHGSAVIPTAFDAAAWHAHEMIFGFAAAVVAGFLLTAIPNWTCRLPLQGLPLIVLFTLWLVGRGAVAASAVIGALPAAALDAAFLVALLAVALREIIAGRNWRNLPMLLALVLLIAANGLTHLQAADLALTGPLGERLGIATLVLLIGLVGGRIIPSFTRNWLAKRGAGAMPAAFGGFDKLCLLATLAALACWVFSVEPAIAGGALLAAGLLNLARLARWQGHQTFSEPLVWSLHLGFLWVPLGLLLLGLASLLPALVPATAGLHALTAGAVGAMTLAVMTRATLGHAGRDLRADRPTAIIYLAVALAAATRVAASLLSAAYLELLWTSALLWTLAFALFVLRYGSIHLSAPSKGGPTGQRTSRSPGRR